MPEFGSPFAGLANNRKLTDKELVRAIRFMVAAEYEAIQLYMQLAESTNNKLAVEVLKDIADEERVHAGEFLRLLHELAPDEEKFYAEGGKRSRSGNQKKEVNNEHDYDERRYADLLQGLGHRTACCVQPRLAPQCG
jgi:rubrerythrin